MAVTQEETLVVDCDFPGGNIVVDKIEGDTILVHQDLRDTEGDWFYWYFRLRGASGRTVHVRFTGSHVIGVHGPGVSVDGGVTWQWLGKESIEENGFVYHAPEGVDEVRFSWGMPYTERNLQAFLARHQGNPHLIVETLCTTEAGRKAERLRVGCVQGEPDVRVMLAARHHCCEMMGSYVLEGILEAILGESEAGQWLRQHVEFFVVPFADKDGVEQGDQGKNRRPHDHNRDYNEGIYATVRAIKEQVPAWSKGKMRFAMDIHCPWKYGKNNEDIYFVGNPEQDIWEEVQRFAAVLEQEAQGLPYATENNLPFGQAWNVHTNYTASKTGKPLLSCTRWGASQPEVTASTSLEVPYANAGGAEVTQSSAVAFGHDIARALRIYLAA
jgi:hypothetical protein